MLLNQLVQVNEKGIVASSVNFGHLQDPDANFKLCEGFIFNFNSHKPENSTVGILDTLRASFQSRSLPNIHLIVQDYGKGKSHFAVTVANFFQKAFDTPEVQGILRQVAMATGASHVVSERLKTYKRSQQYQHLVICLSGDRAGDLRQQFLRTLLPVLEQEGVENTVAQHLCSEPLRYLEELTPEMRSQGDAYLASIGYPEGDITTLTQLLREHHLQVIPRVKELARHLTGFTPDFNSEIEIETILQDLIENLCSGQNQKFQGILILFDELNAYLTAWAADQTKAGGLSVQNITNICERYKGKITLLSLTQISPLKAFGISAGIQDSYKKVASRLAPQDSTYNPASSLELVVSNLLVQQTDSHHWRNFFQRWGDTLLDEARNAHEKRIKLYREQKGWSLDQFFQHLGKGVFPLHPLTAYLLCNLDFVQDRTAIQFIKGYTTQFIESQPVETKNGTLNYIYPIELVDSFIENFSNASIYNAYQKAQGLVIGSDNPHESLVLKALFLYHASNGKIFKSDQEEHDEVLTKLTGLKKPQVKTALEILAKSRDLIYYKSDVRLYQFYEGISPSDLEKEIEQEIKKNPPVSLAHLVDYCNQKYLTQKVIAGKDFVRKYKQLEADWQFEIKVYRRETLWSQLDPKNSVLEIAERGIFAYVLAKNITELQEIRREIDRKLQNSPLNPYLAVAIPSESAEEMSILLEKLDILGKKDSSEKRFWGIAYTQLMERWRSELTTKLQQMFEDCTCYSTVSERISLAQKNEPQAVVSALLESVYPCVLSIESQDKLKSNHPTGGQIVGYVAKQLLDQSLVPRLLPNAAYKTVIEQVFVKSWQLFKESAESYEIQEPQDPHVKRAWDKLSELLDLKGKQQISISTKKLWDCFSKPPFGCSEYVFTVLFVAWMAAHRKEISLKGPVSILKKSKSVTIQTQSLKSWVDTDILKKPREFVDSWVNHPRTELIRKHRISRPQLPDSPIPYDRAKQYIGEVKNYLNSPELEPSEVEEVRKQKAELEKLIQQVEDWFKPTEEVETLPNSAHLTELLRLYPLVSQSPPALKIQANVLSVCPSQEQRQCAEQAKQELRDRLESWLDTHTQQAETLSMVENCILYQQETTQHLEQLRLVTELPPHYLDLLNNGLTVAERRKQELQQQGEIEATLKEIQEWYRSLDEHSIQSDYLQIRTQIENLAQTLPDSCQGEIQQTLQNLNRRYQELCQQIETWEEQSRVVTSQNQILELIKEIANKRRYFTEIEQIQQVEQLDQKLGQELLKVQEQDQVETSIRAELATIQQNVQRIRDLPFSRLGEALEIYQKLCDSHLSIEENSAVAELHQSKIEELGKLKDQGHTIITDKLQEFAKRTQADVQNYETAKNSLEKYIQLLADWSEFAETQAFLQTSLQALETQYQNYQQQQEVQEKRQQDQIILQAIRQIRTHNQTILLCQEGLQKIQKQLQQVSYPQEIEQDVNGIVEELQGQYHRYVQQLQELASQLSQVTTFDSLDQIKATYDQLYWIFKDSEEWSFYEKIQEQIESCKQDLMTLENLEKVLLQDPSIANLYRTLQELESKQVQLNHPEQFQTQFNSLKTQFQEKIHQYNQELSDFEQKLALLQSATEVQEMQELLLQKAPLYAGSELFERYDKIKENLRLLSELLHFQALPTHDLESCTSLIKKLKQWQDKANLLNTEVQERFEAIYNEVAKIGKEFYKQEQEAAKEWLQKLGERTAKEVISPQVDEAQKLQYAREILQISNKEGAKYFQYLSEIHKNSLKIIQETCQKEINKNRGNQIITLFQKLPRLQRQQVYEELGKYLSGDMEESNG